MVSPSSDKRKKGHEAEFSNFTKNKNTRKKKKLSSILKSKKIFLSIKNLSVQAKYETQLKIFGAVITPYLDKEVNYVLTDVPGYNGKSSVVSENTSLVSPSCYSVSPAASLSGDDCTAKKSRTRADAMLERVPVQTQNTSVNPITDALLWNIPVYTIDIFQSWLDKKLSQIQLINERTESKQEGNTRVFEKRYLKLESIVKNTHRPEFKEVSKWPSIDTNTVAGSCPFDKKSSKRFGRKEKNHADKKKESDRMNRTCNKITNDAGYCEICAVHYKDLSQHVTENSHLKFVCNDKNYADLDNCIKTRSVEAFLAAHNSISTNSQSKDINNTEDMGRNLRKPGSLHLNNNNENSAVTRALSNAKLLEESLKQPLQVQCNGFTNYHFRKSTIKSDSVLMKSSNCYDSKDLLRETRRMYACSDGNNFSNNKDLPSQLSPVEDESLHRLRSRRNLLLPSILLGTTAEDTSKHRNFVSPQTPSNHFLRSSASPKSQSTGHYSTRSKLPNCTTTIEDAPKKTLNSPTQNKDLRITLGNTLHFTRSKLNNVSPTNDLDKKSSRSSMSPKDDNRRVNKRKASVVTSEEDERRDSSKQSSVSPRYVPSYQNNHKKPRNNMFHDVASHTAEQNNIDRAHRKRLSAEEKFLEDNKEYYKVEMLRTKLRSTEFYCNREISQTSSKKDDAPLPPSSSSKSETVGKPPSSSVTAANSDESVVTHSKKITKRNSVFQVLSLEAEKFLFGSQKSDKDEDDDKDDETEGDDVKGGTAERKNENDSKEEKEPRRRLETSTSKQNGRRSKGRKRRTHAEVFIHDNLDYYKFEISGSRLRHHGEMDGPVKCEPNEYKVSSCPLNNGTSSSPASIIQTHDLVRVKEEVATTDDEGETVTRTPRPERKRGPPRRLMRNTSNTVASESEKELFDEKVSTPAIPKEERNETTECVTASSTCCQRPPPPESITFSFESVPCTEPWYRTFERLDSCNEQYISIPNSVYFNRYRDVRRTVASRVVNLEKQAPSKESNLVAAHFRRKRRQKFARLILDDKPRKSPRCHASTLAILSSLTSHRRRSRKLLGIDCKKSPSGRNAVGRSDFDNKLAAEFGHEYQVRLKEAVNGLAKDIDDCFVESFAREDCDDRYLSRLKNAPSLAAITANGEKSTTEENEDEWHQCCMQIDNEILCDEDLLKCCFVGGDEIIGDMATFFESSQHCSSLESAFEEEWMLPRSQHDMLSRLCRENDLSCNSSDCGASSTCEFLGFAEDGRTVSRKRKRKRPNLTGWPHERSKRKQIRFMDLNHRGSGGGSKKIGTKEPPTSPLPVLPQIEALANNDNISEADSECTDDDMPLTEIINRKRRRITSSSNTLAAGDEPTKTGRTVNREETNSASSGRFSSRVSLRRSSKNNAIGLPSSLPNTKRLSNSRRKSKCSPASYSRRNR